MRKKIWINTAFAYFSFQGKMKTTEYWDITTPVLYPAPLQVLSHHAVRR